MGNEGSHRRILNRLRWSYIQFVLRRHRNVIGAVGLIPLRERTALNVNGLGLRSLVDRVRSEKEWPTELTKTVHFLNRQNRTIFAFGARTLGTEKIFNDTRETLSEVGTRSMRARHGKGHRM
jgi:hypothetical protein